MTPPPLIHWVTDLDGADKTDKNWNEASVKSERNRGVAGRKTNGEKTERSGTRNERKTERARERG